MYSTWVMRETPILLCQVGFDFGSPGTYTFRALVRVYRPYENAFGRCMGHVAQDAEYVHVHHVGQGLDELDNIGGVDEGINLKRSPTAADSD